MIFDNRGVIGPDVSFYQDSSSTQQQIDFHKMRAAGARFVIIRAGQNLWADPDFAYNWREAKAAGLPRGSYWFFDSRADPKEQARLWWNLIRDDIGELPHFLDLEESYKGTWSGWRFWYDFLYRFQELSNLPLERQGIYTGYFYWIANAPVNDFNLNWFRRYHLWLASYGTQEAARVPAPWSECMFWQFTDHEDGLRFGVESRELDMNYYNEDYNKFCSYFSLTPQNDNTGGEVIPPQEGNAIMDKWKVTWLQGCNTRPEPNVNNTYIATLPTGYEFDSSIYFVPAGKTPEQERWAQLASGHWVALVYSSQPRCALVTPAPTPEPAEDEITVDVEVTATINGKVYTGTMAGLKLIGG